jgi:hypothetical protein
MTKQMDFVLNISISLEMALVTDAHLGGQLGRLEPTLNKLNCLMFRLGRKGHQYSVAKGRMLTQYRH